MSEQSITAFKAFDPDFSCRGHQYEVGKTYVHTGPVKACQAGWHACENPWDTLKYYSLVDYSGSLGRFAKVTLSGAVDRAADKVCGASITIEAELGLPGFIKAGIDWLIDATKGESDLSDNGGYYAQIGSSGNYARIGSSGDSALIGSSGNYAQIGSSGYYAKIGSSGYSAQIGSSGYYAQIGSSGNSAQIGSSGNSARIGSSGDSAQIGSSGYSAKIGSSGNYAKIGSSGNSAQIGSSGNSAKIGSSGYSAQIGSSGYYAKIGSSGNSAQIGSSGDSAQIVATGRNATVACANGTETVTVGENGAFCIPYHDGTRTRFLTGYAGEDGIEAGKAYRVRDGKLAEAGK